MAMTGKTFFRQSKLINMLLGELRVNFMAKKFRYLKKNHLGNICVSTGFGFFSPSIYLTLG